MVRRVAGCVLTNGSQFQCSTSHYDEKTTLLVAGEQDYV